MDSTTVSKKLLKRLPVYLTYLKALPVQTENVSATTMAKALDLGDVQVRKDLAKVSHAGRRRTGRSRDQLIHDIEQYLNFAAETRTIIVGAGKLGRALLDYNGFEKSGLNVMAGFDINPKVNRTENGKPIYSMNHLESFCVHQNVHIGVITVPAENAQAVCDCLVSCGIRAIWNFAPVHLKVPKDVVVQSENLAISLTALRMQLRNREMQQ